MPQAHILAGWCLETQLTQTIFYPFYNSSAWTAQKHGLIVEAAHFQRR
jgi:hypothetical protein